MPPALDLLEVAGNALVTLSIVLAARNSIHTWWTGIVGCTLFGLLCWQNQLYADVLLQAFYVATSLLGWRWWSRRAGRPARPIGRSSPRQLAIVAMAALGATGAYGLALHRYTDAYAPFWDSAVLAFSVAAQCLLMQRRLENWLGWLLVDSIAVPLYASRGLLLTAGIYAVYGLNACYGAWRWWKEWQAQAAAAGGPRPATALRRAMAHEGLADDAR
jgi:nicotinamide mononucleotide transporter